MTDSNTPIYLDYNATTPLDPEVFSAMEPFFKVHFGNPASAGHHWGWMAEKAVQKAREQVAGAIGAKPSEITFTSGATESNNTVIQGLISKLRRENPGEKIHFLTSSIEHSSVMNTMKHALSLGVEVDLVPVDSEGRVSLESIKSLIKPHTRLLSFIWVNNEVGSINPIEEIALLAKEKKIYFHTDATQAVGKIPVNVTEMGIDMLSFSAHKIYGPKGVGALYLRSRGPRVEIDPLIFGGGQERGMRSGTVNVPGVVGFGKAAELAQKLQSEEMTRLQELGQLFWKGLEESIPGIRRNGSPTHGVANNLNITLPKHKTEQLLVELQKLGVSTGSACGTGALVVSHVLLGMGLSSEEVQRSLRISLGRWTTSEEVRRAVTIISHAENK